MGYAVEVRGLKKRYPVMKNYKDIFTQFFRRTTIAALDGVDLFVNHGELFCLVGPNGAGKTTLIKILTTLVLPTEGEAWVNGWSVVGAPDRAKESIGFALGSEWSFYYRLTGRQNLEFFATLNGVGREGVVRVLEVTGLLSLADRPVASYSTGERQMMVVARALLGSPSIIFFDEPTKSLDPLTAERIRGFLKGLVREGKTIVLATHNLEEAASLADRLAIIDRGRIKAGGSIAELTGNGNRSLLEVFEKAVEAKGVERRA